MVWSLTPNVGESESHCNVQESCYGPTNVAANESDEMETGQRAHSAGIPSTPSESTNHNIKGLLYSLTEYLEVRMFGVQSYRISLSPHVWSLSDECCGK